MRTAQLILVCVTLFAGSMKADPEQQQIVDAVTGLMTALANEDVTKFQSVTSPGFYIFDGGARFDGDKILGLIKTLHAAGKRFEWKVTDPDIHIEGDTARLHTLTKGASPTPPAPRRRIGWNLASFKSVMANGRLSSCTALAFP